MKIQTGYLYHIKDEFFNVINDSNLMVNHEGKKKRPTYFTIKDKDILWFIPLSSKVEKYTKIIDKKIKNMVDVILYLSEKFWVKILLFYCKMLSQH